jgi:hypothetical protein
VQENLQERVCIVAFHSQPQLSVEEVLGLELKAEQEAPSPQLVVVLLFQVVELEAALLQVFQRQL